VRIILIVVLCLCASGCAIMKYIPDCSGLPEWLPNGSGGFYLSDPCGRLSK